MTDADLQKKYPLPPEMKELAETMLNGGIPVARPAAVGVEQMRVILQKLKEDKAKTLDAINNHVFDDGVEQILQDDLTALNREIKHYEERLAEYELQHKSLN
jgi:hypothetical protein